MCVCVYIYIYIYILMNMPLYIRTSTCYLLLCIYMCCVECLFVRVASVTSPENV